METNKNIRRHTHYCADIKIRCFVLVTLLDAIRLWVQSIFAALQLEQGVNRSHRIWWNCQTTRCVRKLSMKISQPDLSCTTLIALHVLVVSRLWEHSSLISPIVSTQPDAFLTLHRDALHGVPSSTTTGKIVVYGLSDILNRECTSHLQGWQIRGLADHVANARVSGSTNQTGIFSWIFCPYLAFLRRTSAGLPWILWSVWHVWRDSGTLCAGQ